MLKAILFDLDGTLIPMNENEFTKGYFGLICERLCPLGYNKDELINTIWAGTKSMIKNDGNLTNQEVFWDTFKSVYGQEKLKDKAIFDDFYLTDFKKTQSFCHKNEYAKNIINFAKSLNLKLIIASNPVFPLDGMITRMKFVNLEKNDFDFISSYETSHYSKPNPKFYQELLQKNNLEPNEVIYFCNSEKEDFIPAQKCGIKSFLIGDCIIKDNLNSTDIIYKWSDAESIIKQELKIRN